MSRLEFITAIPWNVTRGSGCYVGTRTLIDGLRQLGIGIGVTSPGIITPNYTATRVLFNEILRWKGFAVDAVDATVGIDADGYTIASGRRRTRPHIACIKGVLGDAVRFERGATRASMAFQAALEARHARRADLVVTVSKYCATRLEELYGVRNAVVVPELINLDAWRALFRANQTAHNPGKFTVLSVCRFYRRKRLDVLLRAAALAHDHIPQIEIRIVGNGPEYKRLRQICRELRLESIVRWLGDVNMGALAAEYNRADVFCLPSSQEGFGIVFLEAMAAGKPVVAVQASAVPEVVRDGLLTEPENPEALADALFRLFRDPDLRHALGASGQRNVERFEMHHIAAQFLTEVAKVAPGIGAMDLPTRQKQD